MAKKVHKTSSSTGKLPTTRMPKVSKTEFDKLLRVTIKPAKGKGKIRGGE